jgi:hypothetical protein
VTDFLFFHSEHLDIAFGQFLFPDGVIGQKLKLSAGDSHYETPEIFSSLVTLCAGSVSTPDLGLLLARPLTDIESSLVLRLATFPHKFVTEFCEQVQKIQNDLWRLYFSLQPHGRLSDPHALLTYAERFVYYFDFEYKEHSGQHPAHTALLRYALSQFGAFGLFGPISILRTPVNSEFISNRPDFTDVFSFDVFPHPPLDLPCLADPELSQKNIEFIARFALFHNPIVWLYAYQSAFHRTFVRRIEEFTDGGDRERNDEFPDERIVEIIRQRLECTKAPLTMQIRTFFYEFAAKYISGEEALDQAWQICGLD